MKRTLNASEMKIRNRAAILKLIRQTGCSRSQIARMTGLTRAAVTIIVDECIGRGMIEEGEKSGSALGRKAVGLRMDPRYGWAVGLNISRRAYTVGIVDFGGRILREFRKEVATDTEPSAILEEICSHIRGMQASAEGKFLGIGITMPGPLDRERGVILRVPNMRSWENFAVNDYFRERFHCDICLNNNSNATAKAEEIFNPAVQGKNFMELIVDSGLGSSVILNIDNRSENFDCEFGHCCIDSNGAVCGCGNVGCAEMYASSQAIVRYAAERGAAVRSWEDIAEGYRAGSEICRDAVERERYYLSRVIINAVNCFPIDSVVFAGDIVYRFGELLAPALEREVREGSIKKKSVAMSVSAIKGTAILSAANLIIEKHLFAASPAAVDRAAE